MDGWELNGEYFPSVHEHRLPLEQRVSEFCVADQRFPYRSTKRTYRSSQNAALLQYRIPKTGSFMISVKFHSNPDRKWQRVAFDLKVVNKTWFISFLFSLSHSGGGQCPVLRPQVVKQEQKLHFDRFISGRRFSNRTAYWLRKRTQLRCKSSTVFL